MTPRHRHPRREDRSKNESWIRTFLQGGEAAVLAGISEGRPTCLPRLYAFDERHDVLYLHGAYGGEVGRMLWSEPASTNDRRGARSAVSGPSDRDWLPSDVSPAGTSAGAPVALTVFEMGRLLPASQAAEFSVEYSSVVVFGRAHLVRDLEEAERALDLLMRKYAPHLTVGKDYEPIPRQDLARTAVVRVDIEVWSGKEKRAPEHSPGAYRFREIRRTT